LFVQTRKLRYIRDLQRIPQLSPDERERLREVAGKFAFRVNDYYLDLIDWSDPHDPIRNLVIPREDELAPWGTLDASHEASFTRERGVQHKYGDTVLLLCNRTCASYCRHCFRKRLFMGGNRETSLDIREGLQYIAQTPEVSNVLLTGGDPLLLSTRRLSRILESLRQIPHVQVIRIGSKIPAYNPWRILGDEKLLDLFEQISRADKRLYLMTHFDHPRELTQPALAGIDKLLKRGVICCNQCPIIRGVNDNPETVSELFRLLSYAGCPPYYLFQMRPTLGNKPFAVPIVQGYELLQQALRRMTDCDCQVRFVLSHETGKIEVVGVDHQWIYTKFHRSPNPEDVGKMAVYSRDDDAYWLDQLKPAVERWSIANTKPS
jgi:lysine 2,3-aminomutase